MLPKGRVAWLVLLLALLAACGGATPSTGGGATARFEERWPQMSWDEVVEEARGQSVNWYLWGGDASINRHVSEWIGPELQARYGITLNRVPINDTVEAVNIVLSEREAGGDRPGAVDLIWLNGENFRTMKQAEILFCGYNERLPNTRYVNWEDPAIANDFGTPVDDCEAPWNRAQVALIYNSATVPEPPRTMEALLGWIREHPGRFAYPAPPDFTGSVFVRHLFYHAAGGPERLLGPFDQALYDGVAGETWTLLNELEPALWRAGATYPRDKPALDQLFANGEVDFSLTYDPASVGREVEGGNFPAATRSLVLEDGTIANTNYVAIPYNAPNKAAALVVANFLLSPEAQFEKARPEVWGAYTVLDSERLPAEWSERFAALPRHEAVVAPEALAAHALPELQADWLSAIEAGWGTSVGQP